MQPFADFRPADDGGAIYQQLADEVQRRVSAGELKAGDRLPPQREFARMLGVNLTTVTRAFAALQRRGVVTSRPGRGSVVTGGAKELSFVSAPERDASLIERGFYMTPMTGRLRVAGTVELGGLARPADPKRWALLDRGARSLFHDLPDASSQWLGFRPSVPDSVPVIGRAGGVPAAILAFGHGHLGLTLAAVTADLVAADVAGHADAAALAAYSPRRHSR